MLVKRLDVGAEELGDPAAVLWRAPMSRKIRLVPAPAGMQNSKYVQGKWRDGEFGRTRALGLQALHNGESVAFRLEWECGTRSDSGADNDQFADAAALLFPLSESAPLMMGTEGAPVNIWHWRADRPRAARDNVATGIGSSRLTAGNPVVATRAVHEHGRWFLVFRRSIAAVPPAAAAASFEPAKPFRMAVAVWNGSNAERAGLKAFSPEWVELTLEA